MKIKLFLRWLVVLLAVGLAIAATVWFASYISIDGFIPNVTIQLVGRIVIDVGVALLAFWSVIFVFLLRSFQTYRDGRITESEKANIEMANLKIKKQYETRSKQKLLDSEIVSLERLDKYFMQHAAYADVSIRNICGIGVTAMTMFTSAILSSAAIMGWSMSQSTTANESIQFLGVYYSKMFIPLMLLVAGIIVIMVGFLLIYPKKPGSQ